MNYNKLSVIDSKEYQRWLQHLFEEIDKQRLKAVMQLNAGTLQHYWWLGKDIIRICHAGYDAAFGCCGVSDEQDD